VVERACAGGGRRLALAVVVATMQMLTGAPEIIFLTWVLLAAFGLRLLITANRRRSATLVRLMILPVAVVALAAAQLLPFLDLLSHSQRDAHFADSYGSMPIWGWANLLVPMFNCFTKFFGVYAQFGQYWTSSYYPGIGVLLLAILAALEAPERRVWILTAVAICGLILALGDEGHLYKWLRTTVPQFGFMRYPIKFVVLPTFCIPLLAAAALNRLTSSSRPMADKRSGLFILFLGALVLMSVAGIVWFAWRYPALRGTWQTTWPNALSRGAFLIATVSILKVLLRPHCPGTGIIAGAALVALVGLDGWTHMPRQNPVINRAAFEPGRLRLDPQPRIGESRAMISPAAEARFHQFGSTDAFNDYVVSRLGLYINCNLLDEIPKVDGIFSLYLRAPNRIEEGLLKASRDPGQELAPLLDFLGVSHITAPGEFFNWTNRPAALPFVTAGQRPVFADDNAIFRSLASLSFAPRETVYLPLEAESLIQVTNRTDTKVLSFRFSAHRGDIEVAGSRPGLLVIAQAYYPRWRASIDGSDQKLLRANLGYQALQIPPGRHSVEMSYRDFAFHFGVLVSVAALVVCAGVWISSATNFASSDSTAIG